MKKLKSLSSVVNDIKYELFTYGDAAEGANSARTVRLF